MGMRMPGWYDITQFGNLQGGQDGAMSVFSGVTCPTRLGGIFGLSCYLLLHNKVMDLVPSDNPNRDTPIFLGHGARDPLIQLKWAQTSANMLKEFGWKVDLKVYPYVFPFGRGAKSKTLFLQILSYLDHSSVPEEIDDLETYLNSRITPLGDRVTGP